MNYDLIIVGAGTAGLTAAIYGVRAGKSVLVLESRTYGGQIVNATEIENYPGLSGISGVQFAMNLYQQASDLGAKVQMETVKIIESDGEGGWKVVTSSGEYETKALIIASGARARKLGLDGEEEYTGKGVSYCATCDGAFFRGKTVAVVGGGNTALEDTLFLAEYCKKVYLIHRRDTFRGEQELVSRIQSKENVTICYNSQVTELHGDQVIRGITVKKGDKDVSEYLETDGIFIAIGQVPDTAFAAEKTDTDQYGYILAGENCKTSAEGIFAAGDCRTKQVRQLTTAAADGAVAALGACEYLETKKTYSV